MVISCLEKMTEINYISPLNMCVVCCLFLISARGVYKDTNNFLISNEILFISVVVVVVVIVKISSPLG